MEDRLPIPGGDKQPVDLLTGGSVWRGVWFLAWPTIITNVLQTAYSFINILFVGRVGTNSIAAVGLGETVLFFQFSALLGIATGTTALVARFYGANTRGEADHATRQSLVLALILSVGVALPLILLSRWVLGLLGAEPGVLPLSVSYVNIILASSQLLFLMMIITSAFRGAGNALTPLYIMLVSTVVNVIGDWLLIFGIGPFPRLGVVGAAWSTSISRLVAVMLAFYFISRSPLKGSLHGSWKPDYHWFGRILRIGVPAMIQAMLRTGGSFFYVAIVNRTMQHAIAQAALTVGLRSEALSFMPGLAFGTAATALVGQNLGAGRPDRARHSGWISAGQGAAVMALMGLAFFVYAHQFAELFTHDPKVVVLVASYLKINAISEPFLAFSMILTGALQGAGETRIPAIMTFVSIWVIRIPLTWFLALNLGYNAVGAWIGMSATTVIAGLLAAGYFKWGKWQKTEV